MKMGNIALTSSGSFRMFALIGSIVYNLPKVYIHQNSPHDYHCPMELNHALDGQTNCSRYGIPNLLFANRILFPN